MSRLFDHKRVWQLTEPAYRGAIQVSSKALRPLDLALVCGIERGGVTPARDLANAMSLPLVAVRAKHNDSDALFQQGSGTVVLGEFPQRLQPVGTVLIVDDIWGTGATMKAASGALAELGGRPVVSFTLCRNTGSVETPDFWAWDVDTWVVFPWEARVEDRDLEVAVLPDVESLIAAHGHA